MGNGNSVFPFPAGEGVPGWSTYEFTGVPNFFFLLVLLVLLGYISMIIS